MNNLKEELLKELQKKIKQLRAILSPEIKAALDYKERGLQLTKRDKTLIEAAPLLGIESEYHQ